MTGESFVLCLENLTWSPTPNCLPSVARSPRLAFACGSPPAVASGRIVDQDLDQPTGATVTFSCQSGMELRGSATVRCDPVMLQWSSAPICRWPSSAMMLSCPSVATVPNSETLAKVQQAAPNWLPGDYIKFQCKQPYQMIGNGLSNCTKTGRWTLVPTCVRR